MKNVLKNEFRDKSKLQLKKFSNIKSNYLVLKNLEMILNMISYKTILIYIPLETEVKITKILPKIRGKKTVLVPFMEGVSFKVVKYRLPLIKKKYKIKEPGVSSEFLSTIDLAIVPVVGVDAQLKRIGYGKGMYDRFFGSLNYKPMVIFIQNVKCFTEDNITDNYDVSADVYITPNDILIKRGINGNRVFNSDRRHIGGRRFRVFHCKKNK